MLIIYKCDHVSGREVIRQNCVVLSCNIKSEQKIIKIVHSIDKHAIKLKDMPIISHSFIAYGLNTEVIYLYVFFKEKETVIFKQ